MILKKTKLICVGIFVFHLGISHFLLPALGIVNFFPFYDWNLFSYNPTVQRWPMIKILEIDGIRVSPESASVYHNGIILNAHVSGWAPEQIFRLVSELEAHGPGTEKARLYRDELERNIFLHYKETKYEAFFSTINIKEFFHAPEVLSPQKKWVFHYKAPGHQK